MRRSIVVLLVIGLAASIGLPSAQAKKKSKSVKPYKSESVTIQVGHVAAYNTTGEVLAVTAQEFLRTCAIPQSNGVDAYVFEVPEEYRDAQPLAKGIGENAPAAGYDIDMYLYDDACTELAAFVAPGTDEQGIMPKGTTYLMLHNYPAGYVGDALTAHFELVAYSGPVYR